MVKEADEKLYFIVQLCLMVISQKNYNTSVAKIKNCYDNKCTSDPFHVHFQPGVSIRTERTSIYLKQSIQGGS